MASGFHIENFGCRSARADGEAIADRLLQSGCAAESLAQADLVVVNTCSVTAEADRSARAYIRRARRLNPAAKIVVTGCYAQRAPQELAQIEGVAAVVGNSHKALAPEIVLELLSSSADPERPREAEVVLVQIQQYANAALIAADDAFAHSFLEEAQVTPGEQTRPNLKIQEGCSNRCTFCVIPATRGPSKSLAAEAVMKQVRGFVEAGGKELVLSGINLGRWGFDLARAEGAPRPSLAALARRILAETGLPRLRLSSVEPMDWSAELLALFGVSRVARHAHMPLQSGSDAVLRRMHRRYRPWHYEEKAAALFAAAGDELTLGADVMAGFPGESDAEFEETVEFLRRLPFGCLHLFPFSPRPGTPGWEMHRSAPVPPRVVAERMKTLRALAEEKSRRHRERFVGRTLEVLTLHTPQTLARKGYSAALSDNFLPVALEGRFEANRFVRAMVTGLDEKGDLLAAPGR